MTERSEGDSVLMTIVTLRKLGACYLLTAETTAEMLRADEALGVDALLSIAAQHVEAKTSHSDFIAQLADVIRKAYTRDD